MSGRHDQLMPRPYANLLFADTTTKALFEPRSNLGSFVSQHLVPQNLSAFGHQKSRPRSSFCVVEIRVSSNRNCRCLLVPAIRGLRDYFHTHLHAATQEQESRLQSLLMRVNKAPQLLFPNYVPETKRQRGSVFENTAYYSFVGYNILSCDCHGCVIRFTYAH